MKKISVQIFNYRQFMPSWFSILIQDIVQCMEIWSKIFYFKMKGLLAKKFKIVNSFTILYFWETVYCVFHISWFWTSPFWIGIYITRLERKKKLWPFSSSIPTTIRVDIKLPSNWQVRVRNYRPNNKQPIRKQLII